MFTFSYTNVHYKLFDCIVWLPMILDRLLIGWCISWYIVFLSVHCIFLFFIFCTSHKLFCVLDVQGLPLCIRKQAFTRPLYMPLRPPPQIIPYYRLSHKRRISASEMYFAICVEWSGDKFWYWFDLSWSNFDEDKREKRLLDFYVFISIDLWPLDLNFDLVTLVTILHLVINYLVMSPLN